MSDIGVGDIRLDDDSDASNKGNLRSDDSDSRGSAGTAGPSRPWVSGRRDGLPGRYALHAVEALVRSQHPTRGLLNAADFIPAEEQTGLMPDLGAWMLMSAYRQLVEWDRALGRQAPPRMF